MWGSARETAAAPVHFPQGGQPPLTLRPRRYLTGSAGFQCIIKESFSDFIVREVRDDGQVAVLRQPGDAAALRQELMACLGADRTLDVQPGEYLAGSKTLEIQQQLRQLLDQASVTALARFLSGTGEEPVFLPAPVDDKATRTGVHKLLKASFPQVTSDTVRLSTPPTAAGHVAGDVPDVWGARTGGDAAAAPATPAPSSDAAAPERSYIRVRAKTVRDIQRTWPEGRPHYTRMVLAKANIDTMAAMARLSKTAHVGSKFLGFAGTKDRRAITAQWATASLTHPWALSLINSKRGQDGALVAVGDFDFVPQPLKLGQLAGNRFFLTLRNLQPVDSDGSGGGVSSEAGVAQAEAALRQWAQAGCGYVNYFGLQRFGAGTTATSEIGRLLLTGQFGAAATALLRLQPLLPADTVRGLDEGGSVRAAAAATMEAQYPPGALDRCLPYGYHIEAALLRGIDASGWCALAQAFSAVPARSRLLFLHAYQSLLWNALATQRLQELGAEGPVEGDLVLLPGLTGEEGEGGDTPPWPPVRHVTAQDIQDGTFTLSDVVLPVPGAESVYPTHAVGGGAMAALLQAHGFSEEVVRGATLAAEELTQAAVQAGGVPSTEGFVAAEAQGGAGGAVMRHPAVAKHRSHPIWGRGAPVAAMGLGVLAGAYRPLVAHVQDARWALVRHEEARDQLYPTELDGGLSGGATPLRGILADGLVVQQVPGAPQQPMTSATGGKFGTGPHTSLALEFTLPAGAYATMALREVMKASSATGAHRQATLARLAELEGEDGEGAHPSDAGGAASSPKRARGEAEPR